MVKTLKKKVWKAWKFSEKIMKYIAFKSQNPTDYNENFAKAKHSFERIEKSVESI